MVRGPRSPTRRGVQGGAQVWCAQVFWFAGGAQSQGYNMVSQPCIDEAQRTS